MTSVTFDFESGPTFTLAVVVSGIWPVAFPYSLFSWVACVPTRVEKAVARCRRRRVFWGGIFNNSANVSALKRGSSIYVGASAQRPLMMQRSDDKIYRKYSLLLTMRPPWTPLPRRLGAYSARSIYCSKPLHHTMVGPLHHFWGRGLFLKKKNHYILFNPFTVLKDTQVRWRILDLLPSSGAFVLWHFWLG